MADSSAAAPAMSQPDAPAAASLHASAGGPHAAATGSASPANSGSAAGAAAGALDARPPPVLAMPTEVLVKILRWALADFEHIPFPLLMSLAGVCTAWETAVLSAPELWCQVSLVVPDSASTRGSWLRYTAGRSLPQRRRIAAAAAAAAVAAMAAADDTSTPDGPAARAARRRAEAVRMRMLSRRTRGMWRIEAHEPAYAYVESPYALLSDLTDLVSPSVLASSMRSVSLSGCRFASITTVLLLLDVCPSLARLDISNTPGLWIRDLPGQLASWATWRTARRSSAAVRAQLLRGPDGRPSIAAPTQRPLAAHKLRLAHLNVHQCGGISNGPQHDDWDDFWLDPNNVSESVETLIELNDVLRPLCLNQDALPIFPAICPQCKDGFVRAEQLECFECYKPLPFLCNVCIPDSECVECVARSCFASRACTPCAASNRCTGCDDWCCPTCVAKSDKARKRRRRYRDRDDSENDSNNSDNDSDDSDGSTNDNHGIFKVRKCSDRACQQMLCPTCFSEDDWTRCYKCRDRVYCLEHSSTGFIQCDSCQTFVCKRQCIDRVKMCESCDSWVCRNNCAAAHNRRKHREDKEPAREPSPRPTFANGGIDHDLPPLEFAQDQDLVGLAAFVLSEPAPTVSIEDELAIALAAALEISLPDSDGGSSHGADPIDEMIDAAVGSAAEANSAEHSGQHSDDHDSGGHADVDSTGAADDHDNDGGDDDDDDNDNDDDADYVGASSDSVSQ
ncbi:hypothetical protein HK105_201314 [Polyrhizophydium stewartii]|uniref:C2H2-type domain-containing protein n=1 Tax=Polyrhizophydium stewartii TaxID=2732419 RepID=A0ABR4NHM8_9FUNG